MHLIKNPDNLLPRGGWPQCEPLFNLTGKKAEQLAQLQRAEQSTKIAVAEHNKILEEIRQCVVVVQIKNLCEPEPSVETVSS